MKFWDTIAKMCGVKIDTSRWGRRAASAVPGGQMNQWLDRADELSDDARGHRFKVEMRDHSLTATVDGHGVRLRDTDRDYGHGELVAQIGLIAIERIRPMKGKSWSVSNAAESIERMVKSTRTTEPTVLS